MRVSLTKELVSPKTVSDFLPQFQEIASDFCNLIRMSRNSSNTISDIGEVFSRLGLETSCTLTMGGRMAFLLPGKESDIARELSNVIHDNFIAMRDTYFGIPFWKIFNTAAYKKLADSENKIYELILKLIQGASSEAQNSVIFQSIMKAEIDEKEKIAAIIDFIAAGLLFLSSLFCYNCKFLTIRQDNKNYKYYSNCSYMAYARQLVLLDDLIFEGSGRWFQMVQGHVHT